MFESDISVKIPNFDGPLGLLLLLIQRQEMDIHDLDINAITKQYLDYLSMMEELNFDVAGDYLYMAATLLLLKSNVCVTEENVGELLGDDLVGQIDIKTKAELIRRLEELLHFQTMGQSLWSLPKKGHEIFVRPRLDRKAIIDSFLCPMDVNELMMAMMDVIQRERRQYKVVKRDRMSIKEKLQFLKTLLHIGAKTTLMELIQKDSEGLKKVGNKVNLVITFISLLELARLKRVEVFQNESLGDIYVDVVNSLEDFDVNQANGFENEAENTEADATLNTESPASEQLLH
jgi:segregation and condensation protein A